MILLLRQLLMEATGESVYPLVFPSTELGHNDVRITYQVVTGSKRYTHQGDARLSNQTVQVSVFGKNYGRVSEVVSMIDLALSGYRQGSIKMIMISSFSPDQYDQDSQVYQKSIDLNILYEE